MEQGGADGGIPGLGYLSQQRIGVFELIGPKADEMGADAAFAV